MNTADFEAGVDGAVITTGAGEASATAWTLVEGSPVYSNAHVAHGTLAAKIVSGAPVRMTWSNLTTSDFGRMYLYATANPSGNVRVIDYDGGFPAILCSSSGQFGLLDTLGATYMTAAITLSQWVRIEWHFDWTAQTTELKFFNSSESTSPTEIISHSAQSSLPASNTAFVVGNYDTSWGSDYWIDSIVSLDSGYPGPAGSEAAPQVLSMLSHVSGHNMT